MTNPAAAFCPLPAASCRRPRARAAASRTRARRHPGGVIQGAPADAALVPQKQAAAVGIASPYAARAAVVPPDDMLMALSIERARRQLHNDPCAIAGGGRHRLPA